MPMENILIAFQNVWKIYQMGEVQVNALKAVNVKFRKGEFVAIVGPSGSGKSTMMNLVGCLDIPTKGQIFLKGRNIARLEESDLAALRGRTIGFVFQQYNLIPGMKAIGAKNQDIMLIFLCNSAMISLVGGIIGILIGTVAVQAVLFLISMKMNAPFEFALSLKATFISTLVSIVVGLIAGLVPAKNASELKPVDALRYE